MYVFSNSNTKMSPGPKDKYSVPIKQINVDKKFKSTTSKNILEFLHTRKFLRQIK